MRFLRSIFIWALVAGWTLAAAAQTTSPAPQTRKVDAQPAGFPPSLSAADFTKLIREFSEAGGSFYSDNLLSNETSYLHIVDKLKALSSPGGAYLGVGPEQNFTYIAKTRPRIAFIVDLRHMALIQHLLYKAIFYLSPDRVEFMAKLLSRPLVKEKAPPVGASLDQVLTYFYNAPPDDKFYAANLTEIRQVILENFQYQLTDSEQKDLEYIFRSFRHDGLAMTYQWNGSYLPGYFPTLREVIAASDLNGRQGNFLASSEDYDFVRDLQRKNLVIAITGNFAGPKALAAIGQYLQKYGLKVSVFYLSNVEQYLFEDDVFSSFVSNIKKLPIDDRSLFIRTVLSRFDHPAHLQGHQFVTLLQKISLFIKDFDEGRYRTYSALVNSNYISPGQK